MKLHTGKVNLKNHILCEIMSSFSMQPGKKEWYSRNGVLISGDSFKMSLGSRKTRMSDSGDARAERRCSAMGKEGVEDSKHVCRQRKSDNWGESEDLMCEFDLLATPIWSDNETENNKIFFNAKILWVEWKLRANVLFFDPQTFLCAFPGQVAEASEQEVYNQPPQPWKATPQRGGL